MKNAHDRRSSSAATLAVVVLAAALIGHMAACDSDDDAGGGASSSGTGGSSSGTGGSSSGTGGGGAGQTTGCELDGLTTPWPDWVPAWPGNGRNATQSTTFWALEDGAAITGLSVSNDATSAVVSWTTPGDADSTVGWGTELDSCTTGYHRTGARREHQMLVGPLQPQTEYFVTVRSRDDSSSDHDTISFTTTAVPGATELTDCTTINTAGDYLLTADVTADCTCMRVEAADVNLDLGWHTITYADTATGEQCHGVTVEADNVEVSKGIVRQGSGGGDIYSHAVRLYGVDEVTVEKMWLQVVGSDAFGLRAMFSDAVYVRHVLLVSEVVNVTDRHYPGNRGISLDVGDAGPGEVRDCILFGVPHWGIHMTGGDKLASPPSGGQTRSISNNHVFADMHATNGYGLGIYGNDIEVDHNEIRPLHNGRALHYGGSNAHIHHNIIEAVELIAGDPANGYAEYSDLSDPHSPHDITVCTWVVAHGIRVEGGNFAEIAHNEVYSFSLADVSFGATGLNVTPGEAPAQGGLEVHHNQFTAFQADGSISCSGGLPMMAGWVRGDPPAQPADLHDNRFVSSDETLVIESGCATSTNDELVQL